ncbi:MAG: hypothetical protein PHW00_00930 [Clostridia bacterium]|nr:hypothetical protein [Clostridia bacterium]
MRLFSQKSKLIISIVALIVAVALMCTVTFAWFTIVASTGEVSFVVARINSKISLYKALDNNYDGIPNFGIDANEPIGTPEHFQYTIIDSSQAVAESAANINMNMELTNLQPTQIHIFKIYIINNSEASNTIRMVFSGYDVHNYPNNSTSNTYTSSDFDNFIDCLSLISVRVGQDNNGNIVYGDKIYLGNTIFTDDSGNKVCNLTIMSGVDIASILQPSQNKMNIYLRFEVETLDSLTASVIDGGAGMTMTNQEYQEYQGRSFVLPLLKVYLEID